MTKRCRHLKLNGIYHRATFYSQSAVDGRDCCFQRCFSRADAIKEQPNIRRFERSEAISSFKARLLRWARKDEVHGLSIAALGPKTRNAEQSNGGKIRQAFKQ